MYSTSRRHYQPICMHTLSQLCDYIDLTKKEEKFIAKTYDVSIDVRAFFLQYSFDDLARIFSS